MQLSLEDLVMISDVSMKNYYQQQLNKLWKVGKVRKARKIHKLKRDFFLSKPVMIVVVGWVHRWTGRDPKSFSGPFPDDRSHRPSYIVHP
jgi:hypothetical protein